MPNAISLFSGAGGMDLGFMKAGFDVKVCVEIDPACCETLQANIKESKILNRDVSNLSGRELLSEAEIEFGDLDMLFGGPPCQSFSLAGNRKGLNDSRGQMVFEFVRLVKETAPKTFVMENVAAMANWNKGEVLNAIEREFEQVFQVDGVALNYRVTHEILNAADFGVPQSRKRIFIIGNRLDKVYQFPKPTHHEASKKPYVTVADALSGLPDADAPSKTALRVSQTIPGRRVSHGY